MKRSTAIDFTRGLVMIIMAIDHIRDLIHIDSLAHDPTDLATTTPFLFFTRWITHLCAPTFVFLSGSSAYLSFKKKNNLRESQRFLLTRGLWLIILEITIVNFGIWFDIQFRQILLQVIFAIGFSFVFLSFLIKYSPKILAVIGLIIIFGGNLLQLLPANNPSVAGLIVGSFFSPNFYVLSTNHVVILGYPVIPWLGIMLTGFAVGKLFELPLTKRKSFFLITGFTAILLFIILRYINVYGDASKWSVQKNNMFTFLSFMNVTKYPPSLLYSLITLGIMFLVLYFSDGVKNKFTEIIMVYGKVPLFYYLIHWYLVHTISLLIIFIQGFHWQDIIFNNMHFARPQQPSGLPLWGIYIVWICVIIFMYPICKWYGRYKLSHPEKRWLSFL